MPNPPEQKPVLHTRKHIARLERERIQTRYILAGFISIIVIVVGLLVYGYVDINYLQPRRPVAEVGGVAIPVNQWQARVRMERRQLISEVQLYQQYQEYLGVDMSAQQQQLLSQLNSPITIGQSVLDKMIDEEIIRQEAESRGLAAGEQEVEQAIQASFRFYPLGTPTASMTPAPVSQPTLSPETLALVTITPSSTPYQTPTAEPAATPDSLASPSPTGISSPTATVGPTTTPLPTSTPITQQGYEESYKTSVDRLAEDGLTEEELRQLYEVDILRQRLLDQITADVPREQEQVWARHILVADDEAAKGVLARIEGGEDFAAIAAEASTDTSNKDQGGDLGWFGRGTMVTEFEVAAFSLKVGEVSQPIKTQFGYHIIQVLAHGDVALDADAYETARQSAFDAWLLEARKTYGVVTHDYWQEIVPVDPAAPTIAQ